VRVVLHEPGHVGVEDTGRAETVVLVQTPHGLTQGRQPLYTLTGREENDNEWLVVLTNYVVSRSKVETCFFLLHIQRCLAGCSLT